MAIIPGWISVGLVLLVDVGFRVDAIVVVVVVVMVVVVVRIFIMMALEVDERLRLVLIIKASSTEKSMD